MTTQKEVLDHILEIKEQLAELEGKLDRHIHVVHRAFPRNDLQEPDFDGHRHYHTKKVSEEKIVSGYKQGITEKILQGVIGFILMLLGMGAVAWLKGL
jgi:hypothetical protein